MKIRIGKSIFIILLLASLGATQSTTPPPVIINLQPNVLVPLPAAPIINLNPNVLVQPPSNTPATPANAVPTPYFGGSATTTSSTPTTPDSSNMNTINNTTNTNITHSQIYPTGITAQHPQAETNINPITGAQQAINPATFPSLPGCPNDPSRTALSAQWPTAAACPDINGTWPTSVLSYVGLISSIPMPGIVYDPITNQPIPAQTAFCPTTCSSTRYVSTASGKVTGVQEATCPAGYEASAVYNMQPEYVKLTTPQNISGPILWTDYINYKNQGYNCTATYGTLQAPSEGINGSCIPASSPTYTTYSTLVTIGSSGSVATGGTGSIDTAGPPTQDSNGYAGEWIPSHYSGFCYYATPANCTTLVLGNIHPGNIGCTPTDIYNVYVYYGFYYFSCSMAAGTYVGTNSTQPASVVCSRISSQWKSP